MRLNFMTWPLAVFGATLFLSGIALALPCNPSLSGWCKSIDFAPCGPTEEGCFPDSGHCSGMSVSKYVQEGEPLYFNCFDEGEPGDACPQVTGVCRINYYCLSANCENLCAVGSEEFCSATPEADGCAF